MHTQYTCTYVRPGQLASAEIRTLRLALSTRTSFLNLIGYPSMYVTRTLRANFECSECAIPKVPYLHSGECRYSTFGCYSAVHWMSHDPIWTNQITEHSWKLYKIFYTPSPFQNPRSSYFNQSGWVVFLTVRVNCTYQLYLLTRGFSTGPTSHTFPTFRSNFLVIHTFCIVVTQVQTCARLSWICFPCYRTCLKTLLFWVLTINDVFNVILHSLPGLDVAQISSY